MRYVPYHKLDRLPNIIVDGAGNDRTLLTLSHWPHSGTPEALKDDLSTQIVFHYLDRPDLHVQVEAVSNNHFDEDGLVGIYTILNPEIAQAHRSLLIDIAAVGDFETYRLPEAARIAFVIQAFSNSDRSPLNREIFNYAYPDRTAALYQEMLVLLPEIIDKIDRFQDYWRPQEELLKATESDRRLGKIKVVEISELDLAIVTIAEEIDRYHPIAINNSTSCCRLLFIQGRNYQLQYRYETWVQYRSRPLLPRVDLHPLAQQLSQQESAPASWKFDGVEQTTPSLHLVDAAASNIAPEDFCDRVKIFLATAPPAWNPFD